MAHEEKQNRIRRVLQNVQNAPPFWSEDIIESVRNNGNLSEDDLDRFCSLVLNMLAAIKWLPDTDTLQKIINEDDSFLRFIEILSDAQAGVVKTTQMGKITQTFLKIQRATCQRVHYYAIHGIMDNVKIQITALSEAEKRLNGKISDALNKIDTVSAEAGERLTGSALQKFSNMFSSISRGERYYANCWLSLTIFFGFLLFWNLFCELPWLFEGWEKTSDISRRIAISAGCVVASLWSGRRYSIAYNQHVTYRHLRCLLDVFNRFRGSMNAKEQELITLEAARTLFPVPKIASKTADSGLNLAVVVDLIRTLSQQKDDTADKK